MIRRLVQAIVVFTGIMLALDLIGATRLVAAVIGTAGLAGLALGFAFKDIMENYLAGAIMAFRQPFAKNDHIRVAGFEGKLVRLTPRETILMTLDGNHVRMPNALLLRSPMLNFSRNPLRRFEFDAGLGSRDDLAQAREVAVAALAEMKGVLRDPAPEARVMALGDSTVTMQFLAWVDQRSSDFDRVRSEAIRVVKARLEAAGLTLPSPEYFVRMPSEGEREAGAVERPAAAKPTVTAADVAVDYTVDEQIETDRRESGEPDLLTQPADVRVSGER
jgi:small-conductance mechanosensitive channel